MPTGLGRSRVEVQRCPLSSEGPGLRSSGAHCAQNLAVEVQQCPLRAEVGEELGEELAKSWRRAWRRAWRRVGEELGEELGGGGGEGGGGGGRTALIKSNNPHLAGGEKTRLHTPRGAVVAESWVLSFFLFFCFLFFPHLPGEGC